MRRFLAALALTLGIAGIGVALAAPALAHAELSGSDPADQARLDAMPAAVTLTFSETVAIDTGYLRVIDADGKRVDTGTPQHPDGDPTKVSVGLQSGLGDGGYVVSWRVVSADSHPVGGGFSFAVGDAALPSAAGGAASGGAADPGVAWVFGVIRWVGFTGLTLLGALVFLTVCWRDGRTEAGPRRLVWTGWGMVSAGTLLGLLLEGPYGAGTSLRTLGKPSLLDATLRTTYGQLLSARLILLAVLGVLMVRLLRESDSPPWLEDLAALAGFGVLATYGGSGHAATSSQPPITILLDAAHLAAMGVWLGGLIVIAAFLLRRRDALAGALPVFSRLAMISVAVLAVTGTYRSWVDIGSLGALTGTAYGRIVLVKVALLALLVVLGNAGRLWVRRFATAGHGGGADPVPPVGVLRRSVLAELTLAAVVLAFTAVLVTEPPARAVYSKPADTTVTLPSGDLVQVTATPAKAGPNEIHVYVLDKDGKPRDAVSVTATARLPGSSYDKLPVTLSDTGPGHYTGTAVSLPAAGAWQFDLTVRLSEFDSYAVTAAIPVG